MPRRHGLDVAGADPHGRRPRPQARDRHAARGDQAGRRPHHLRARRRCGLADPGPDRAFPPRDRGAHRPVFAQGRYRRHRRARSRQHGRGGVGMTMSQPSFWWQRYGTLAQMAQAAVALLGFVAILIQINEIRTNNRTSSARAAFLGYTDLAFKNPKFAQPDYEKIKASSRDEQVQYESFVTYFLYACEEAINA